MFRQTDKEVFCVGDRLIRDLKRQGASLTRVVRGHRDMFPTITHTTYNLLLAENNKKDKLSPSLFNASTKTGWCTRDSYVRTHSQCY